MSDPENAALWYSLHRFVTRFWREVDLNAGASAHAFYGPDAVFAVGANRFDGAGKIQAFYAQRQKRGIVTTRHVVDNLLVQPAAPATARFTGILSIFYADGPPPIHGAHPPMLIADIDAECVGTAESGWLFRSHVLSPVFVGRNIPISMSFDTGRL